MGNETFSKACIRLVANEERISEEDVYIVWLTKVLQNNKALVSTIYENEMYYEITYNGDKKEFYFDAYRKQENRCIKLEEVI